MSSKKITSNYVREKTIEFSCKSGAGHLASSLSTVEILTVLFNDFLSYEINSPKSEKRDRLILSKGHGAYAYYIILNILGFLPDFELENFYTEKATIKGCLTRDENYMIEASTGSLGHGLPIAVGMAKSFKTQNKSNRVVCIVGDGEMQEGSNYEALQFAYKHKLDNLLIIVDANGLQAMSQIGEVGFDSNKLSNVLKSIAEDNHFMDIDGHNEDILRKTFYKFFYGKKESFFIVNCKTIKGKGLKMIENKVKYHFRCPTEDGYVWSSCNE